MLCDLGEVGVETHRPGGHAALKSPLFIIDVSLHLGWVELWVVVWLLEDNLYSKPSGVFFCHNQNCVLQVDCHQ